MVSDDNLKDLFKNLTARQRLAALRNEMVTPLAVVHGYATLLTRINLEDQLTFPKDYNNMIESILQAHHHMRSVLDALTSDIPSDQTKSD